MIALCRLVVRVTTGLVTIVLTAGVAHAGEPYLDLGQGAGGIANLKAVGVGDIITVRIVENAEANTYATTDATSKTEVSGGPGLGILGQVSQWGLKAENKFEGEGESERTGYLTAQISTRVVEEMPNGNLRIEGERMVDINGEQQILTLSGIIRSQDLRADNSIASNLIADARISYTGDGPVADAHSPGLLSRVFNFLF
jgi:flagellar L-ring protein FlgH